MHVYWNVFPGCCNWYWWIFTSYFQIFPGFQQFLSTWGFPIHGGTPKLSILDRDFPYKPFILGYPHGHGNHYFGLSAIRIPGLHPWPPLRSKALRHQSDPGTWENGDPQKWRWDLETNSWRFTAIFRWFSPCGLKKEIPLAADIFKGTHQRCINHLPYGLIFHIHIIHIQKAIFRGLLLFSSVCS